MRCAICDKQLTDKEIDWDRDHQDWMPCGVCLEVINSCFEPLNEDEVTHQIEAEWASIYQDEFSEQEFPELE